MKNKKFFNLFLLFLGILILVAGCVEDLEGGLEDLDEQLDDVIDDLDGNGGAGGVVDKPLSLSPALQKECPESCDDYNPCTGDICGKKTGYKCENTPLNGQVEGCSGQGKICEQGICVQKETEETDSELSIQVEDEAFSGEEKTAKWTLLIYLDADNNLEGAGISDLNEMEMVGSSSDVNIVVQMDRHPSNSYTSGYDGSNGDWSTTKRFYVLQDSNMQKIKSKELKDLGEVNMGNGNILEDFLVWGIDKYPAEHYLVVLWNHGSGFDVAFDESSDDDYISLEELEVSIEAAKEKAGKKIDIVGFDACLMGMIEVDYALKDHAEIRVGSEETEPFDGWNYEMAFQPLVDNPDMTPEEFATIIVDKYYESYQHTWDKDYITQAAVNLTKLDDALVSLNKFSDELYLEVQAGGSNTILSARNGVQEYASYTSIDLIDFATIIKQTTSNPNLKSAAEDLVESLEAAVINNKAGEGLKYSHGIAAYFPSDKYYYESSYYKETKMGKNEKWDDFLDSYFLGTGNFGTILDVKNFQLSSNTVSPSKSVTVSAVISGENINTVDLIIFKEISYEGSTHLLLLDDIYYNPPSYLLEDESHIATWVNGDNYFSSQWNAYGTAISDGNNKAFTILYPSGRDTDYYYAEGVYEQGSESFFAVLNFNLDTGDLISIYDSETYNEAIPSQGDKFIVYRYAFDEQGNEVYVPSDTLTYGEAGFTAGYYELDEGSYYLALFATDAAENVDYEGEYVTVQEGDPGATFCLDGTEEGQCSITYASYICTNGELVYDETCLSESTCSDGTLNGQCSESYPGYICQNGFLELNEEDCLTDYGNYCYDGTPSGECSYWYDGWMCIEGEYYFDDSCYFNIVDYSCSDGTLHGKCSNTYTGQICYYGELYEDSGCTGSCSDGTLNGYCSEDYNGYLCYNGELEYNYDCDYYNYNYYCWDGTVAGYCSNDYPGYYCDYDGYLYYYQGCEYYGYGNSCEDGTEHGQCSETNEGEICWNGFLFEAEECGYDYDYTCSDGTYDGYCSAQNYGYYCSQGELLYDDWCIGSCSDGTQDGYCSYSNPGYLCSQGQLTYSSSCEYYGYDDNICYDGTYDGYCSEVYPGYACYGGELYYDSYCDEYYSGYCVDGTMNGYCSANYPGYGCVDGVLSYYAECEDYGYSYCSDGTATGYCSSTYSGYWCNYYGQLDYNEGCDYSDYCSDGTTMGYCSASNIGYWCNYDLDLEYSSICEEVYNYQGSSDSCFDWLYNEYINSGYCTQDNALYCYEGVWYSGADYCYGSTSCYDSLYDEYIQSGYCTPDNYLYCYEGVFYDGENYCGSSTSCYDSLYDEYIQSGYCTQDDYYYCYNGEFYYGEGYCY